MSDRIGVAGDLVYLVGNGVPAGERVTVAADPATLEECRTEMRASIARMKDALADPARNVAREDAFPRHDDRDSCRRCPFRRPCGRM